MAQTGLNCLYKNNAIILRHITYYASFLTLMATILLISHRVEQRFQDIHKRKYMQVKVVLNNYS